MKKFLLAMALMPLMVLADTEVVDGVTWTYTINDGKAQVGTGLSYSSAIPSSTSGAITIPSTLGGCPVTGVGDYSFYGCRELTSVVVPSSITDIGEAAFYFCYRLTSVTIPSSVIQIGRTAFANCSIENVYIDNLLAFARIRFEDECSNPMVHPAASLYADGKLVEETVKVSFVLDDDWFAGFPDESAECGYSTEMTIEKGVERPVYPPEVIVFDGRFEVRSWDADLCCVMDDTVAHPIYGGADINEAIYSLQQSSELDPQCCSVERMVYDVSSGCVWAQGTIDTAFSPLCDLDDTFQYGYIDERLYENLRIRLVGRDEQGSQVCQVDLPRYHPSSDYGFTWSGALPIDTNVVRQVDVALASTWYEGEYVLRQIPVSNIACRRLAVRKIDLADLHSADYELVEEKVEHHYYTSREDTVTSFDFQRELKGEECEAVYEFTDRNGLYNSCFISYATINGVLVDLSRGGFAWVEEYDSTVCVSNVITLYYSDDFTSREEWQGMRRVELRNWSVESYTTTVTVPPRKYTVQFDLAGCGVRIGGGELNQKVDRDKNECEEFPIVEANPHCTFLCWAQPYWEGNTLVYVAEYDREYVITYENTRGVKNPNPSTYTTTNGIVFTALADTDEYWFRGWEPTRIEVGAKGDLVVTAKWERIQPAIEGDEKAEVTGDAEKGFVIKPSEGKTAVEVTIPQGVDAAKVTVEVSVKVASVKPNGAKVRIVNGANDITEFLNVPAADGNGVVDLAKATVKEEIVKEAMDVEKGAVIDLSGGSQGTASPVVTTAPTREGLFYQLREGVTLDGMKDGDSTVGDGQPWTPEITVKGGKSAFYSIGVGKGE